MHRYLALTALILDAPVAARTPPPVVHSNMPGMNNGMQAKPMEPMDHRKMQGVDHSKMGGVADMMKNTLANPYAETGMAMHHNMMVVGANAS